MDKNIVKFQEHHPSIESYWRSIILFGRNVASYKFSLAETLLELSKEGKSNIRLDELAIPYSKYICKHIKESPKQTTSPNSKFLNACLDYTKDNISHNELVDSTVANGLGIVLDKFHNVNGGEIPTKFYTKSKNGIILTDELFELSELLDRETLNNEVESRWNLVETAWELGINRSLLSIKYDDKNEVLFIDKKLRRKDVTSVRGALNGYQKGKCFYCNDDIVVSDDETNTCDVDHFFPHILQNHMADVNINGVWNLVLTCKECNRGINGKFALVPDIKFLYKLDDRNNYLISSHHPLRETLMQQTGITSIDRMHFLNKMDERAIELLHWRWKPTFLKGEDLL